MAGSLALGETLTDAEMQYGLSKLNQMLDIWSIDRLAIPVRSRVGPFNLVAGTQSYTVGTGGAWDTARPMWIDAAGLIDLIIGDDVELPMRILTLKEWARVPVKTITSELPRSLFFEKTYAGTSPLATVWLYPIPSEANQVILYVPVAVPEFATIGLTLALPPGYRMAVISNLAVLLAMGVTEIEPAVAALAAGSYAAIKAGNVVDHMDPMVMPDLMQGGGEFNWMTGETA